MGWSIGHSIGRLVNKLLYRSVGGSLLLIVCLGGQSVDQSVPCLFSRSVNRLVGWSIDQFFQVEI